MSCLGIPGALNAKAWYKCLIAEHGCHALVIVARKYPKHGTNV